MTHDRVGSNVLPLKRTFLATMLGVHRPTVTVAAGAAARGHHPLLDRRALERAACGRYEITRRSFEQLRRL
jgi:hypothetical protein